MTILPAALALVSQGVEQTFAPYQDVTLHEPTVDTDGNAITMQKIAVGPAASQVAIKQLGTNGGGCFNVNAAHPLENPDYLTNMVENISILLIPIALVFALGFYLKNRKLALTVFGVMTAGFILFVAGSIAAERHGNTEIAAMGIPQPMGRMEGKEIRLGADASAMWGISTTVTSNGSVNAMHDSMTPLSGGLQMLDMMINSFYGGVGVGFLNYFIFIIIGVFIAGLLVGRTPEFLGRKSEAREVKIATLIALLHPFIILVATAIASYTNTHHGDAAWTVQPANWLNNPGPHGFSEMLYDNTSSAANNGSGFEGLGDNNFFWNFVTGLVLILGRVVTRVHAQAGIQRGLRGVAVARQLRGLAGCAPGRGIGLVVELHAVRAYGPGGGHLLGDRVHEQAHAHAQCLAFSDQGFQTLGVLRKAPAVVAGELVFAVGHEGGLVRANLADEVHEVLRRVALDVVFAAGPGGEQFGQDMDVVRADVALVRPRMHRDACRTGLQTEIRCAGQRGNPEVARIAHQCNLVQVDGQGGLVHSDWSSTIGLGTPMAECTTFYAALVECSVRKHGYRSGFYVGSNCGYSAQKIFSCVSQGISILHLYDWGPIDGWAEGSNAWSEMESQYLSVMQGTHALGPVDEIVAKGTREPRRVGLLYNRSHEILSGDKVWLNRDWMWTFLGLRNSQIPVDVVIEEDLTAAGLAPFQVLYVGGWNLDGLPSGAYFLRLQNGSLQKVISIIKAK